MTKLLISVKNVDEAVVAFENEVDIIDLKDPSVGALGALSIDLTEAILNQIKTHTLAKRILTSATVGENHRDVDSLIRDIQVRADIGVDIIKLAWSPFFDVQEFKTRIPSMTANGVCLVCVFFAEQSCDSGQLARLNQLGFYGAMLDTQSKSQTLTELKSLRDLSEFVSSCKQNHLMCGLAGSLNLENATKLLIECIPDFVGFRGGACQQHSRVASLDVDKVLALKQLLLNHNNNHV